MNATHDRYRRAGAATRGPYRRRYDDYDDPRGGTWPVRPARMPRGWILGVCAWLARYFGVETWVVRVVAVTGLLFLPSVVFPAYIISGIVLRLHYRWDRDHRRHRDPHRAQYDDEVVEIDPSIALRDTEARMRQIELKLRRMEAHVTSGHFELQREFNRLDR